MNKIFIFFINIYKVCISPFLPSACKFYPSCSSYANLCFNEFSVTKATCLVFLRLIRCNPFSKGGVDFPKHHRGSVFYEK